jgi:hypothetical protein
MRLSGSHPIYSGCGATLRWRDSSQRLHEPPPKTYLTSAPLSGHATAAEHDAPIPINTTAKVNGRRCKIILARLQILAVHQRTLSEHSHTLVAVLLVFQIRQNSFEVESYAALTRQMPRH